MKTYPLINDQEKLYAFEIKSTTLGISAIADLLKSLPEVSDVQVRKMFRTPSEIHIEFGYCGREFMVWEPFGDNSRYWIGPKSANEENLEIENLENAFKACKLSILGRLLDW